MKKINLKQTVFKILNDIMENERSRAAYCKPYVVAMLAKKYGQSKTAANKVRLAIYGLEEVQDALNNLQPLAHLGGDFIQNDGDTVRRYIHQWRSEYLKKLSEQQQSA